jgi:hypothetical protein
MHLVCGGARGSCCAHLRTLVSGRPLDFGSSLDRMGFWHGQSRLRLIDRSHTQQQWLLFRRGWLHPWIANRRSRLPWRSRRKARSIHRSRLPPTASRQEFHDQSDLTVTPLACTTGLLRESVITKHRRRPKSWGSRASYCRRQPMARVMARPRRAVTRKHGGIAKGPLTRAFTRSG